MNRKRWVSLGLVATVGISLDEGLHLAWLVRRAASVSHNNRDSRNFFGNAAVWKVAIACQRWQTAILL
jgi:hypothetical protein